LRWSRVSHHIPDAAPDSISQQLLDPLDHPLDGPRFSRPHDLGCEAECIADFPRLEPIDERHQQDPPICQIEPTQRLLDEACPLRELEFLLRVHLTDDILWRKRLMRRMLTPASDVAVDDVPGSTVDEGAELLGLTELPATERRQDGHQDFLRQVASRVSIARSRERHQPNSLAEESDDFLFGAAVALTDPIDERQLLRRGE
jgi:hypothetical protein